jgi:hypothetical protein
LRNAGSCQGYLNQIGQKFLERFYRNHSLSWPANAGYPGDARTDQANKKGHLKFIPADLADVNWVARIREP